MKTVSWFSCGVSSAVATKLLINDIDEIYYIDIDDHHGDNWRFLTDCERWFNHCIFVRKSELGSVENACRMAAFINSPRGAACTDRLKKRVRKEYESQQKEKLRYVWGLDKDEKDRADRIISAMPQQEHLFPLIEKNISKEDAHKILNASDIKRPVMYDLGYNNNNCVGCVKGGMGYWNKIRVDFPEVFKKRSELERLIGASCINGVFLDELDPERGRESKPIVDDCGIMCELMRI